MGHNVSKDDRIEQKPPMLVFEDAPPPYIDEKKSLGEISKEVRLYYCLQHRQREQDVDRHADIVAEYLFTYNIKSELMKRLRISVLAGDRLHHAYATFDSLTKAIKEAFLVIDKKQINGVIDQVKSKIRMRIIALLKHEKFRVYVVKVYDTECKLWAAACPITEYSRKILKKSRYHNIKLKYEKALRTSYECVFIDKDHDIDVAAYEYQPCDTSGEVRIFPLYGF